MINAALFICWSLAVVIFDCGLRRIPNWLVIAGLACACALAASGYSPFHTNLADAGLGLAAGFFALIPFYVLGVMGAADVKVFAVLGAWCGVRALPWLWIAASLAAGVYALWLIASSMTTHNRTTSPQGSQAPLRFVTFVIGGRRTTPYAAMLALAAIGSFAINAFGVAR